jgi:RimJ/RimL family protein N-acetyltransferase
MSEKIIRSPLLAGDLLKGRHVYLRPPRQSELQFIRKLWTDPDTMAPVGGTVKFSDEKATRWFTRMVDPGNPADCYCLVFNEEDEPVGEVSFHRWNPENKTAGLNIKVLACHRGKGYAKDALHTFLTYFFGPFGGLIMTDDVGLHNHAGQRFLSRFGFQNDSSRKDVCMMRMTKEMFVSRSGDINHTF